MRHLKLALDELYLVESLQTPNRSVRRVFKQQEWRGILTPRECAVLDECFDRFQQQAFMLYERFDASSTTNAIRHFDHFVRLESDPLIEGIWDKVKKFGRKVGRAFRSANLEKGGKLIRDKDVKAKDAEGQSIATNTEVGKAAMGALGKSAKYFPNNDDFEEFKEDLEKAVTAAFEVMKKAKDEATVAEHMKHLKKWIVYLMDYKLGDYYKHFKGGSKKKEEKGKQEESLDRILTRKSLSFLLEAESDKKDDKAEKKAELGTTKAESGSWQGLLSNALPLALLSVGLPAAGFGVKMFTDALSAVGPIEKVNNDVVEKVWETVQDKKKMIEFDFSEGLDKGINKAMKANGFDPTKPESVKAFYDFLDNGEQGSFSKNFAKFAGRTGNGAEDLMKYMDEQAREKGMNPLNMGFSKGTLPGFHGKDFTGGAGVRDSVLAIPNKHFSMEGSISKRVAGQVVKQVVSYIQKGGVDSALALKGAALAGAGVGALISAGVIKWLRVRSKTESRLAILGDLLDKLDERWKSAGAQTPIAVTPSAETNQGGGGGGGGGESNPQGGNPTTNDGEGSRQDGSNPSEFGVMAKTKTKDDQDELLYQLQQDKFYKNYNWTLLK